MKRSIARKWSVALESGEYVQGKGKLRKKDGSVCVLGVLCNLHAQEHPEFAAKQKSALKYGGHSYSLPAEVIEWGDLKGELPSYVDTYYDTVDISYLNDKLGYDFKAIAKVIRKHWKEL